MSIRPVDFQVVVPKMAEVDKMHKASELPQHDQRFADEVRQMVSRQQREVQPRDHAHRAMISDREKKEGQRRDPEDKQRRPKEKESRSEEVRTGGKMPGTRLDVRI